MKGRKKGGEKRGKKKWRKDEIIERERNGAKKKSSTGSGKPRNLAN